MRARFTKKNRDPQRRKQDCNSFDLFGENGKLLSTSAARDSGANVVAQARNRPPQPWAAFLGRSIEHAVLHLSLNNDLRELAVAAERVDAFCAEHGVSPDIAFAVNVSVDELLTNTISYGFDDGDSHRIEMTVRLQDGVLVVELVDDATPYDPTRAPHPDIDASIEDRPIGGLGVHFVRALMDGFRYRRSDGRNIVTLTKRAEVRPAEG